MGGTGFLAEVTYGAKGVAEAGRSFIVERVCLAKDEGEAVLGKESGLVDLFGDGRGGGGVVHEGVLEGYAGGCGAVNITGGKKMVS